MKNITISNMFLRNKVFLINSILLILFNLKDCRSSFNIVWDNLKEESFVSYQNTISFPPHLLSEVKLEYGEKPFRCMIKAIKYYHDSRFRDQIKKREKENIKSYRSILVNLAWTSQLELKSYLIDLHTKTINLQALIPQYTALIDSQNKTIAQLRKENLELQLQINDLEDKNENNSLWTWFRELFMKKK